MQPASHSPFAAAPLLGPLHGQTSPACSSTLLLPHLHRRRLIRPVVCFLVTQYAIDALALPLHLCATVHATCRPAVPPAWAAWPGLQDPTSLVVVGAAAVLGAACRAPLTAIALMVEITRDTGLLVPLLAAIGVSSLFTDFLEGVFSKRLEKVGVRGVGGGGGRKNENGGC